MRGPRAIRDRWRAGHLLLGEGLPASVPVLIALLAWSAVIATIAVTRFGGDMRGFLCLGSEMTHTRALEGAVTVSPYGYDGQYYAALACDPLLRDRQTVRALDAPSYRATRAGVPLLAWLLAFGDPARSVMLYQLLCWGLAFAGVVVTASWTRRLGASPLWALLAATSAGMVASVLRTTPDAAASSLILIALALDHRGRRVTGTVVLTVAALVRETSVLAALAVAAVAARERRRVDAVRALLLPGLALAVWQLFIRHALGVAFDAGSGNFTWPLRWLVDKLAAGPGAWPAVELLATSGALAGMIAAVTAIRQWRSWSAVELCFVSFAVMALVLSNNVFTEAWAYARVLAPMPLLAIIVAAKQQRTGPRVLWLTGPILLAGAGVLLARAELRDALDGRALSAALRAGPRQLERIPVTVEPPLPAWVDWRSPRAATVADGTTAWLLPAVHLVGRGRLGWRTEVAVRGLGRRPATVALRLLGVADAKPRSITVELDPGSAWSSRDVVGDTFHAYGPAALALAVRGADARVVARTLTDQGEGLAVLEQRTLTGNDVVSASAPACFQVPVAPGPIPRRVNVHLLQLGTSRVRVQVVSPAGAGATAIADLDLGPGELRPVNDLALPTTGPTPVAVEIRVFGADAAVLASPIVLRGEPPVAGEILPIRPGPCP